MPPFFEWRLASTLALVRCPSAKAGIVEACWGPGSHRSRDLNFSPAIARHAQGCLCRPGSQTEFEDRKDPEAHRSIVRPPWLHGGIYFILRSGVIFHIVSGASAISVGDTAWGVVRIK